MPARLKKKNWENISLIALLALGVVFLLLLVFSFFGANRPHTNLSNHTDLINANEIANLSVSQFVYNGIARKNTEEGKPDYNVLYRSTVKASVDAEHIDYAVDDKEKTVKFIFPEVEVGNPVIDVNSLSMIPDRNDLYIDEVIKLCRNDALEEAKKSKKLITSAQENLKSIIEAWYSPVFEGYSFEYQFGALEGGEDK